MELLWNNIRDSWKFGAVFPSAAAQRQKQLRAACRLSGREAVSTSMPSAEIEAGRSCRASREPLLLQERWQTARQPRSTPNLRRRAEHQRFCPLRSLGAKWVSAEEAARVLTCTYSGDVISHPAERWAWPPYITVTVEKGTILSLRIEHSLVTLPTAMSGHLGREELALFPA